MNIKQFLKPDWKKVIAIIIIAIIALMSSAATGGAGGGPFIGKSILSALSVFLVWPPFVIIALIEIFLDNDTILQLLFLFIELVYFYLISCVIICFWNDNKNKFRNYWRRKAINKLSIVGILVIIIIVLTFSIYRDMQKVEKYAGPAPDSRRQSDIRQISLAMEMYYDNYNQYPKILLDSEGRIINKNIGTYLDPIPTDPGGGEVKGCNDQRGASYGGFSNTSDRNQYCIYACLYDGGYFAASEKGTKRLDKAPTGLDCWE